MNIECHVLFDFHLHRLFLICLLFQLKIFGKRGVHKDTKLQDVGGQILEKDGILYNCAFALSDKGPGLNEYGSFVDLPFSFASLLC